MNLFKKKQSSLSDISASFHPVAGYSPKGATAARKYHEERFQNQKRFFRSCPEENNTGGMIVFPVGNGAALEADILVWLTFFVGEKHWNVGRSFGGRYTAETGEFSDCSVTVDLWDISWTEVLQTAEHLQKNFCPFAVLIKNFATGAVWLLACDR